MKNEDFIEKTIAQKRIYSGSIIDLTVDTCQLPNGSKAKRELVFHPGAVGIMPITESGKMIFVKQFRKALNRITLEIPAGKIDPEDQDTLMTARRELEEETGFQSDSLIKTAQFYTSPGFCNELIYLYLATNLKKVENPLPPDEDEVIELFTLSLEEANIEMKKGNICDAKTIYALQYWELEKLKGTL